MYEERIQVLLAHWKDAFGRYARLKTAAENAVVRWENTTAERYSPLPYYFQRFPGRGRVIRQDPPAEPYFVRHGFDTLGRALLRAEYQRANPASSYFLMADLPPDFTEGEFFCQRAFYLYSENFIEILKYSGDPYIPIDIQQVYLKDGHVFFHAAFRLNGYTHLMGKKGADPQGLYDWLGYNGRFTCAESFLYDGERLDRITGYYESPGLKPYSSIESFSYDPTGKLLGIEEIYEDGRRRVVYRKRLKGQTFARLGEEVTEKLVEAVLQRMRDAHITGRVYAIILSYRKWAEYLPPYLIVVPESHRLDLLRSPDPSARHCIFSPIPEKEWFHAIDDPQVLEACQVVEQEIHAGEKWTAAEKILREVAFRLNKVTWQGILDVTPDFVVYPLDAEMDVEQLGEILAGIASHSQLGEWRRRGWL